MILTTGINVEGSDIVMYKDIVFGEVITGANFMKDIGANVRNFFGGRAKGYEKELINARQEAMDEMVQRAKDLNANAIIGIQCDYQVLGEDNGMLMVTCSGTAVITREK